MKMKFLLALLLSFHASITINAMEEDIKLYETQEKERLEDNRSLYVMPRATYDESAIYIYTDMATNDVAITVKDVMGNVVYSHLDTASSRSHVFSINSFTNGYYLLEIEIGEDCFYGHFSL